MDRQSLSGYFGIVRWMIKLNRQKLWALKVGVAFASLTLHFGACRKNAYAYALERRKRGGASGVPLSVSKLPCVSAELRRGTTVHLTTSSGSIVRATSAASRSADIGRSLPLPYRCVGVGLLFLFREIFRFPKIPFHAKRTQELQRHRVR